MFLLLPKKTSVYVTLTFVPFHISSNRSQLYKSFDEYHIFNMLYSSRGYLVGSPHTSRHMCVRHTTFVSRLVDEPTLGYHSSSREKTCHGLWLVWRTISTPHAVAPPQCAKHGVANDGCHSNNPQIRVKNLVEYVPPQICQ